MPPRPEPLVADGSPFVGELVAAVDESAPQAASGVYFVVAAVVIVEPVAVTDQIRSLLAGRLRGFHWNREGTDTRFRMLDLVTAVSIGTAIRWRSTSRTSQLSARADVLGDVVDWACDEGVDHLVVEASDEAINARDRQVIARRLENDPSRVMHYDHRSKHEPVLWMADALAGAVSEYLVGKDDRFYGRLLDANVITPI